MKVSQEQSWPSTSNLTGLILVASAALLLAAGCSGPTGQVQLSETPFPEPDMTLIWHGTGEAYRQDNGVWERRPEQDYEFTVVQRRYDGVWESTKEMHRRHPLYDGVAGPRDQSYFFSIRYGKGGDASVPFEVRSSLGDGNGSADKDVRQATMDIKAEVSSLAPFDTYTIEQRYLYERGELHETVTLLKTDGNERRPWVRVEEKAKLFHKGTFDSPPTQLAGQTPQ